MGHRQEETQLTSAPWGRLYPARAAADVAVVAVGARDPARAAALAARWAIPRHGDYAAVLADPEVEAVYIALVNGQHFAWAAAALRAGKHVLLEKPLTHTADEARALARTHCVAGVADYLLAAAAPLLPATAASALARCGVGVPPAPAAIAIRSLSKAPGPGLGRRRAHAAVLEAERGAAVALAGAPVLADLRHRAV